MTSNACPHCGATPYSLGKKEELQTRCEQCNGLIVGSEDALNAAPKPAQGQALADEPSSDGKDKEQ